MDSALTTLKFIVNAQLNQQPLEIINFWSSYEKGLIYTIPYSLSVSFMSDSFYKGLRINFWIISNQHQSKANLKLTLSFQ